MITINDLIIGNTVLEPAYRRGQDEGLQKGLEEGRAEGERSLLRRLLEQRFGILPSWAEEQLMTRSHEGLQQLASRVFEAVTLDDLFR